MSRDIAMAGLLRVAFPRGTAKRTARLGQVAVRTAKEWLVLGVPEHRCAELAALVDAELARLSEEIDRERAHLRAAMKPRTAGREADALVGVEDRGAAARGGGRPRSNCAPAAALRHRR